MKYIDDDYLFVEKYRPRSIEECILPERLKKTFKEFVKQGEFPSLLLAGGPGTGKTSVAKAMCHEMGLDAWMVNGTTHGNIDILRNEITQFAATYSLMGGGKKKVLIYDEADYLSWKTQPALRGFIEDFSSNCTCILTCNYKNKIMEPIRSRTTVIDFDYKKEERPKMMGELMSRIEEILMKEGVQYQRSVIAELIKIYFPDIRRVLNELQRYSASGVIDSSILSLINDTDISKFIHFLAEKNFKGIRKWIWSNSSIDYNSFYTTLFDEMLKVLEPSSIPQMTLIIGDYQNRAVNSLNQQINLLSCCVELMSENEFK